MTLYVGLPSQMATQLAARLLNQRVSFAAATAQAAQLHPYTDSVSTDTPKTVSNAGVSGRKDLKLIVPHVIVTLTLLVYICVMALVIRQFEAEEDVRLQKQQRQRVHDAVVLFAKRTHELSQDKDVTEAGWKEKVDLWMMDVTEAQTGERIDPYKESDSRWNFVSSMVYSMAVLSTCGYAHLDPTSLWGQLFVVACAVLGIPLLFVTAADIGKFFAESIIEIKQKALEGIHYLKSRKSSGRETWRRRDDVMTFLTAKDYVGSVAFPVAFYVATVCSYSLLGAFLMWYIGDYDISRGFYFSFMVITTVGIGNLILESPWHLMLLLAYIIIGLSVVTMCVNIASQHLKTYFEKLHYFGRARNVKELRDSLRQLMRTLLMTQTVKQQAFRMSDLERLLQQMPANIREQLGIKELVSLPYLPKHLHLWRFIDDRASDVTTSLRRNSWQSDMICSSFSTLPSSARCQPHA